jgi:hypothetical protein
MTPHLSVSGMESWVRSTRLRKEGGWHDIQSDVLSAPRNRTVTEG